MRVSQNCSIIKQNCYFFFQDHLEICLKFPIGCVLNCGQDAIPRDMMEEHVATHCPNAVHLCPFSIHGCDFKVSFFFPFMFG